MHNSTSDVVLADQFFEDFKRLKAEIAKVIIGQDEVVKLLLTAIFCQGHSLLTGVPGLAKTLMVSTLARILDVQFKRIQFTPDLMPSDITGTNVLEEDDAGRRNFRFVEGPIFTNILLADEINRTPPKTQAALLQAMQERTVTIDGDSHPLGDGFMVIATQNPIEQQGTYPLPEAQLDRFLFKHLMSYPSRDEERAIVARHGQRTTMPRLDDFALEPVADGPTLLAMRAVVADIRLSDDIVDYIVDVIRATRTHPSIDFGASPRAGNMIASAARAFAVLHGRDYVIPDDVKALAVPALRHRLVLTPGAQIEGVFADQVIVQILEQTQAPR